MQALYLVLGIEDNPSKTPGMNPIRMPIDSLPSRRASQGKHHNTPYSRMRSILSLSKEIFWSQPQHMAVKKSRKEITYLDMIMIGTMKTKNISCTVFCNKVLQSDMGKTIVRKYAPTLDAQSVWKEFETHMSTSSKRLNERCRLHAYLSTTVYDSSWKGTTEQFVLHFNEQFR